MKTLLHRLKALETRSQVACGRERRRLRIVLRDVNARVGLGTATCQRSHDAAGNMTEIINFYGCAFGKGQPNLEEQEFAAWIDTLPIDGVVREYRPKVCCR